MLEYIYVQQSKYDALTTELTQTQVGLAEVFEMLVALSIQIDSILMETNSDNKVNLWFSELIKNLRLKGYDDLEDNEENAKIKETNSHKISIFLQRQYKRNGDGGLFPLESPELDQRTLEIWYQMMAYLGENYSR